MDTFILSLFNKQSEQMEVICLEDAALYDLIEKVIVRLRDKNIDAAKEKWVSPEDAMQLLTIKSKTTLQKLRDEGKIKFSQPQKKIIVYDRYSILEYLEKNVKHAF